MPLTQAVRRNCSELALIVPSVNGLPHKRKSGHEWVRVYYNHGNTVRIAIQALQRTRGMATLSKESGSRKKSRDCGSRFGEMRAGLPIVSLT